MPKKESQQQLWRSAAYCVLCTLGIYLIMQCLNALLVAREVVGEGSTAILIWASAGIATLAGVLLMGRGWRTRRLLLGGGCALGFLLILLMCALVSGGSLGAIGGQLAETAVASLAGGTLAALIAQPRKSRKNRKHR